MNMNEKEVALWSEGGLNVTLTIRLLMHGKVRLAKPCIINVYELSQRIINSLLKVEITPDCIILIYYQPGKFMVSLPCTCYIVHLSMRCFRILNNTHTLVTPS